MARAIAVEMPSHYSTEHCNDLSPGTTAARQAQQDACTHLCGSRRWRPPILRSSQQHAGRGTPQPRRSQDERPRHCRRNRDASKTGGQPSSAAATSRLVSPSHPRLCRPSLKLWRVSPNQPPNPPPAMQSRNAQSRSGDGERHVLQADQWVLNALQPEVAGPPF